MEQTRRLMPHPFGEQTAILPFDGKNDVCLPKTRAKTAPHALSLKRAHDLSHSRIIFIRHFAEAAEDSDGLRTFKATQVDQLSAFLPQNGKNAVCWTRKRTVRPARSRALRARMKRAAAVPAEVAADWNRTPRACSAPRGPPGAAPRARTQRAPHTTHSEARPLTGAGLSWDPRETARAPSCRKRIAYALIST